MFGRLRVCESNFDTDANSSKIFMHFKPEGYWYDGLDAGNNKIPCKIKSVGTLPQRCIHTFPGNGYIKLM